MIVKDEAQIIERCCEAAAKVVDCYVICDTGSSDDTVERIERVFAAQGIPGEVVRAPFINFEQARNAALDAARESHFDFDYVLLCDADMELCELDGQWRSELVGEAYGILQRSPAGLEYPNVRLLRRDHPARYVGTTHEYIDVGVVWPVLDGLRYHDHAEGSSRVHKFERDIRLLSVAVEREPTDTRSIFYLANSYYDSGDFRNALVWYKRRITMAGYRDEVFISLYRLGLCHHELHDEAAFSHQMLHCYDQFPDRAEPLHSLALHAQRTQRHRLALAMAQLGAAIPKPQAGLFIEAQVVRVAFGRHHRGLAVLDWATC